MTRDTKLLQAIVDSVSAVRTDIQNLKDEVKQVELRLGKKIETVEKRLTDRINKIGSSVAYLEDDTPLVRFSLQVP
ncbi:hypothetical protein A2803_05990 [Candidatus Woesebacteria bacterium RIFCSPHIGHO2_01_FULL_44_21]|uniref:Uncharacterized protein n=1 Tax=Candidatus Woesebacteria bacterium RIFCSPHIGHO2_01_FULL_44_21 TaxID=1802503 RepID=A0A1F7Z285_9BACT|nr:MAG: hypothetical protein A2803_05990 [Candidatus Woesebacteria bacterium RIFCSPHIGHO2_01_FULL_44_21]OGM71070.1 MAG: hypothetical protein A2897_02435 [Candidatus Woesebacteria bacterium RIFCSPLOWO2_01_FULL_44_24b]